MCACVRRSGARTVSMAANANRMTTSNHLLRHFISSFTHFTSAPTTASRSPEFVRRTCSPAHHQPITLAVICAALTGLWKPLLRMPRPLALVSPDMCVRVRRKKKNRNVNAGGASGSVDLFSGWTTWICDEYATCARFLWPAFGQLKAIAAQRHFEESAQLYCHCAKCLWMARGEWGEHEFNDSKIKGFFFSTAFEH